MSKNNKKRGRYKLPPAKTKPSLSAQLKEATMKEPQKRSKQQSIVQAIKLTEDREDPLEKKSNKRVAKVFSGALDSDVDDDDLGELNVDGGDDEMIELIEEQEAKTKSKERAEVLKKAAKKKRKKKGVAEDPAMLRDPCWVIFRKPLEDEDQDYWYCKAK